MNVKRSVVAIAVCLCGVGLLLATYKASASTTPNRTLNPRWTADGEPPPPPKPPYPHLGLAHLGDEPTAWLTADGEPPPPPKPVPLPIPPRGASV